MLLFFSKQLKATFEMNKLNNIEKIISEALIDFVVSQNKLTLWAEWKHQRKRRLADWSWTG